MDFDRAFGLFPGPVRPMDRMGNGAVATVGRYYGDAVLDAA